ncbi:MAG: hypothetical protein PHS31_04815 [Victivallaceae bacterium]|nr:hypothetical protein [Victivallaceae bacterium]
MSDKLVTFIFFIIAGIFWVVKQVYEQRARKEASMRRQEKPESSFFEDDNNEYNFEEFESDAIKTPELAKALQIAKELQLKKESSPAPLLNEPEMLEPNKPSRYAKLLRQNSRQAIIMQEILSPPKALRRN